MFEEEKKSIADSIFKPDNYTAILFSDDYNIMTSVFICGLSDSDYF